MKIDFNKLSYYKYKTLISKKYIDQKKRYIDKYASIYKVDADLIYGILIIENINRGSIINKLKEKVSLKTFPRYIIKLDPSLGIGQVKISTAKTFYPEIELGTIAHNLMTDEFNIKVVAQIIQEYNVLSENKKHLLRLVKYYTTGNPDARENPTIFLYYLLLRWIINESLISK